MARKLSLDEHWECAPDLTPEQKARVADAAAETDAMREKALAWVRDNAARITVTAESEDEETVTDIDALEAAIEEESAATLSAWLEDPEGVTLNGGWGYSDSIIHVNVKEAETMADNAHFIAQLCAGRHTTPATQSIFPAEVNPLDMDGLFEQADAAIPEGTEELDLFVTGLTSATLAVTQVCFQRGITLTAHHFNRDTGDFIPQRVLTFERCGFCKGRIPVTALVCPFCGG